MREISIRIGAFAQRGYLGSVLILAAFLSLSGEVRAAPSAVTIDGREYTLRWAGGRVVVLPAVGQVELHRDAQVPRPSCELLGRLLRSWAPRLADCRDGTAGEPRCERLRAVIEAMRGYEEDFLQPRLTQRWRPEPQPPIVSSAVRQEVARRLDLDLPRVRAATAVELTGAMGSIVTLPRFSSESWPGQAVGVVDFSEPPARYNETAGAVVTEDHLVACGLLDGVVRLAWTQSARVTVAMNAGPPLVPVGRLWEVYRFLREVDLSSGEAGVSTELWRALQLGAALGSALADEPGWLSRQEGSHSRSQLLAYVVTQLFDAELNLSLSGPEEAHESVPEDIVLDVNLPWIASGGELPAGGERRVEL